jgi:hypothetical protein
MSAAVLKRLRPVYLVLFFVGIVGFVVAAQNANHTASGVAGLVTFTSLGFFVFTEAFLFSPPQRAPSSIWLARVFFVPNALAVLSLVLQFLESLW